MKCPNNNELTDRSVPVFRLELDLGRGANRRANVDNANRQAPTNNGQQSPSRDSQQPQNQGLVNPSFEQWAVANRVVQRPNVMAMSLSLEDLLAIHRNRCPFGAIGQERRRRVQSEAGEARANRLREFQEQYFLALLESIRFNRRFGGNVPFDGPKHQNGLANGLALREIGHGGINGGQNGAVMQVGLVAAPREVPNVMAPVIQQQAAHNFDNRNIFAPPVRLPPFRPVVHRYKHCCSFCFGTSEKIALKYGLPRPHKDDDGPWSNHSLKENGIVRCPTLRGIVCRYCGAHGDNAHTDKYHEEHPDQAHP